MKDKKVVIVGGAGNVGVGIGEAFKKAGWGVEVVDPKVNSRVEEYTYNGGEIVYCAECGNRDEYANNPGLSEENNSRFANFCKELAKGDRNLVVWYVGGSWTKRKPDEGWLVGDDSVNKTLEEANPYEKAKIMAEENAKNCSVGVGVRFVDWISIVPNMADNFTIPKMVVQAKNEGKITYSSGLFGRPLLSGSEAGRALLMLLANDDSKAEYRKLLIPGIFTPFSIFARTVKMVVEKEIGGEIELIEQESTPDFLKSRVESDYLKKLGFEANEVDIEKALEINAREYLKKFS